MKIEFDFGITPKDAKRAVEEPFQMQDLLKHLHKTCLLSQPYQEIDVNEFPIININLSGEYPVDILKEKADLIKDRLESNF